MIQTLLFFGLGFLTAAFLALLLAPALRRRTVRLTERRIAASLPLTRDEIQSEKDRLKADFAVRARRLEIELSSARSKASDLMVARDRAGQRIEAEQQTLAERDAAIERLEAEARDLKADAAAKAGTIESLGKDIAELEERLADAAHETDRLSALYEEASMLASSRQIELVSRETEIDRLAADVAALRNQRNDVDRTMREVSGESRTLREALKTEIRKAQMLGKKVDRLTSDLISRDEKLARREQELARLKGTKPEPARKPDAPADPTHSEVATMPAENPSLPDTIAIEAERDRLEARLTAMQGPPFDVSEGDALRESIHRLAAEMVLLAHQQEGGELLLGDEADEAIQAHGEPPALPPLADRIRALRGNLDTQAG